MVANELNIKGETFRLDFSLLAFLTLGQTWGLKTIDEVIGKIALLDNDNNSLSLDALKMFDEIVVSFVNSAEDNPRELKPNEVLRMPVFETMTLLKSFSVLIANSLRTETTEELGKKITTKKEVVKK